MGAGRRRRYLESADDCHVTTETQLEEEEPGLEEGNEEEAGSFLWIKGKDGCCCCCSNHKAAGSGKPRSPASLFICPLSTPGSLGPTIW